jgi:dTDP-4-amino-4,6-dideoxy-D-galactose acyltransferase
MVDDFIRLIGSKEAGLTYYSPFSFLRATDPVRLCRETFTGPLIMDISIRKSDVTMVEIEGHRTWFVWRTPAWDSEYFQRMVVRVELILPDHDNAEIAGRAITRFSEEIAGENCYISVNIPCEDLFLIRSMAHTGYRLVETRLNYYFDSFDRVTAPSDPVRLAVHGDIPVLSKVAMRMRNRFDRVHADPAFSDEVADAYLGKFIEQSIKGFADMVMVPDIAGVKPFAFLAADYPAEIMGFRIAKLVLAAADNREHKGWLSKLLTAVLFELKQRDSDILTTITQASNRPAIRTWENAGFRLGFVTHLYSYSGK